MHARRRHMSRNNDTRHDTTPTTSQFHEHDRLEWMSWKLILWYIQVGWATVFDCLVYRITAVWVCVCGNALDDAILFHRNKHRISGQITLLKMLFRNKYGCLNATEAWSQRESDAKRECSFHAIVINSSRQSVKLKCTSMQSVCLRI